MKELERAGRIVTFYSYKGGTGRSMALANVAWILASQNQRVLTVDWDLEAPGLHRYFQPFISDTELTGSAGIIDFLAAFVDGAHSEKARSDPRWFERYIDTEPYTFSLDWKFQGSGTLDLIPAGQQGPAYAPRVTDFEWRRFYDTLGGGTFLQAVKARWRAEYDWILIDSRTGISDTSGICTVQMPDDLVVCFTLNNQSVLGACAAAKSVLSQRLKPDGSVGLRVLPLVTRVERAEHVRLSAAMELARDSFGGFLAHLPEEEQKLYFANAQVHYQPFYAFEEVLAAFGDPRTGPMLSAMEKVCSIVTDGRISKLGEMSETERVAGLARFLRQTKAPETPRARATEARAQPAASARPARDLPDRVVFEPVGPLLRAPASGNRSEAHARPTTSFAPTPAREQRYTHWFYLSYARSDWDAYLQRFFKDLVNELRMQLGSHENDLGFVDQYISLGEDWNQETSRALATSRLCVCIFSPAYFKSAHCGKEFNGFTARSRLASPFETSTEGIFPVDWLPTEVTPIGAERRSGAMPGALLQNVANSAEYPTHSGLRRMLMRSRRSEYGDFLHQFARILAETGQRAPLPVVDPFDVQLVPSAFEGYEPALETRSGSVAFLFMAPSVGTEKYHDELLNPAQNAVKRSVYGALPDDWQPFGETPIRVIALAVAAENELTVESPGEDIASWALDALTSFIARAERNRTPVVLVVAMKALSIPPYRQLLQALDKLRLFNLAVVVVMDGKSVTKGEQSAAASLFQDTFEATNGQRNDAILALVQTEEELKKQLHQTLAALKVSLVSNLTARALHTLDTPVLAQPSLEKA